MSTSQIFDPDLGDRITHFVQQDDGRMITGMVVVMDYINEDGIECTSVTAMPDQKITTTAGLVALADTMARYELNEFVRERNDLEGGR